MGKIKGAYSFPKRTENSALWNPSESAKKEKEKSHSVNSAFNVLRTLIPTEPVDRKLSKIETLRLASSYILHLSSHVLNLNDSLNIVEQFDNSGENACFGTKICTFCLSESKKMRSSSIDVVYSNRSITHANFSVDRKDNMEFINTAECYLMEPSY